MWEQVIWQRIMTIDRMAGNTDKPWINNYEAQIQSKQTDIESKHGNLIVYKNQDNLFINVAHKKNYIADSFRVLPFKLHIDIGFHRVAPIFYTRLKHAVDAIMNYNRFFDDISAAFKIIIPGYFHKQTMKRYQYRSQYQYSSQSKYPSPPPPPMDKLRLHTVGAQLTIYLRGTVQVYRDQQDRVRKKYVYKESKVADFIIYISNYLRERDVPVGCKEFDAFQILDHVSLRYDGVVTSSRSKSDYIPVSLLPTAVPSTRTEKYGTILQNIINEKTGNMQRPTCIPPDRELERYSPDHHDHYIRSNLDHATEITCSASCAIL